MEILAKNSIELKFDVAVNYHIGTGRTAKTWVQYRRTWNEFVNYLLSVQNVIHHTREKFDALDKKERDRAKDKTAFVGGRLQGNRRKKSNVIDRSIIALDADYAPANLDIGALVDGLDFACLAYTTVSHIDGEKTRFRLVIPSERPMTPEEYEAVARKVAEQIGIEMFDDTTFEVHRLMYLPTRLLDQEPQFWLKDAPILKPDDILAQYDDWRDVSQWARSKRKEQDIRKRAAFRGKQQQDPGEKNGIIGAFCRTYDVPAAIDTFLSDVYQYEGGDRYTYTNGSTSKGVVIYEEGAFAYSFHGTDPAGGRLCNAFDLVRIHLFGELDAEADEDTPVNRLPSFKAMMELAQKDEQVQLTLGREQFGFDGSGDISWVKELQRNQKGAVTATARNYKLILENDPELAGKLGFNEFTGRRVVLGPLPWRSKPGDYGNDEDNQLMVYIEGKYGIWKKECFTSVVDVVCRNNSFHPIRDYLNSLEWDGVPRAERVFVEYLGVEDNEHVRKLTKKHLVAAVKRVFEPGCKRDELIVLVGPQGIGKSMVLDRLGKEWFSDNLDTMQGKESYEALQGSWIIELAELAAIRRTKDVELVKKFISKRSDKYRPPYARLTEEYPRQCIFFGTTNRFEFLVDETGNRRYWPLMCTGESARHWSELTEGEVDQIWAEVFTYYREGYPVHLDPVEDAETIAWLEKAQERHTEENPKASMIREFLEMKLPKGWYDMRPWERKSYFLRDDELAGRPEGTEERKKVCAKEIWFEVFGHAYPHEQPTRKDVSEINAIIESSPGWERMAHNTTFKPYGKCRGFIKKS